MNCSRNVREHQMAQDGSWLIHEHHLLVIKGAETAQSPTDIILNITLKFKKGKYVNNIWIRQFKE